MQIIPKDQLFEDVEKCLEVHRPARNSVLKVLRDNEFKVGVEVGVQYGQNVERLLDGGIAHNIYGVDPYDTSVGTITPLNDKQRDAEVYGFALGKLDRFKDRYTHIKKTANEALFDIDKAIDFVYLDGNNTKEAVYDDLTYWYPKVREGGIIVGHNYDHPSFRHIKTIVNGYFKEEPAVEEGYIWWRRRDNVINQKTVSVVTPWYNTAYFLPLYLEGLEDPRISEVIIVDDCSEDEEYDQLVMATKHMAKIKVYRNAENIGELKTRMRGAEIATSEWVVFLDGDNSLTKDYLDKAYMIPEWRTDVIYHPDFGNKIKIDYTSLSGNYIGIKNIGRFLRHNKYLISMFLNTGNFLMNRKVYLEAAEPISGIHKHAYGDIWFNYHWMKNNKRTFVVPHMKYVHRRRKGSAWKEHQKHMQPVVDKILDELWTL